MTSVTFKLTLLVCWTTVTHATSVLPDAILVPAGGNVTLSCNFTLLSEIAWIRLRSNHMTRLAVTRRAKYKNEAVTTLCENGGRHRVTDDDALTGSVSLQIEDVRESDLGLYCCVTRDSGGLTFTGSVSQTELPVCVALLGAAMAANALLTTALVYRLCCVPAKKTPDCRPCFRRSNAQKNVDLQYASLQMARDPCPALQRPPFPNDVIYAIVTHQGAGNQSHSCA